MEAYKQFHGSEGGLQAQGRKLIFLARRACRGCVAAAVRLPVDAAITKANEATDILDTTTRVRARSADERLSIRSCTTSASDEWGRITIRIANRTAQGCADMAVAVATGCSHELMQIARSRSRMSTTSRGGPAGAVADPEHRTGSLKRKRAVVEDEPSL